MNKYFQWHSAFVCYMYGWVEQNFIQTIWNSIPILLFIFLLFYIYFVPVGWSVIFLLYDIFNSLHLKFQMMPRNPAGQDNGCICRQISCILLFCILYFYCCTCKQGLARIFITGCPNWDFKNSGCPKSLFEKVKIITLIMYINNLIK